MTGLKKASENAIFFKEALFLEPGSQQESQHTQDNQGDQDDPY
jgi:hypothetical protein